MSSDGECAIMGPLVVVERTNKSGVRFYEELPVIEALYEVSVNGMLNGIHWMSARIIPGDVDMGFWDRSA